MLRCFFSVLLVCAACCSGGKTGNASPQIVPEERTIAEEAPEEEIPDSSYRLETRIPDVFVRQTFYPGYYWLETIRKKNGRCEPIDSIFCYGETSTPAEKIVYDPLNDWYTYWSEGEGTGDFSRHIHFLSVTRSGFREVFSYPEYQSMIDVESKIPRQCISVESKMLEMNRKRIQLLAIYEDGYEQPDHRIRKTRTLIDTATYLSDPATGVFSLHRYSNPAFERFWKGWWYPD